jgi:23S rRNA G2445 N2-methylase RlmL
MLHNLTLSPLGHTWILDLDGTIVKHNGYKLDGYDTFLEGAEDFLRSIPESDMIIFLTSRTNNERALTEKFLRDNKIRYDEIIFNVPYGERILINDMKPSGLKTSISINAERDVFAISSIEIDDNL